MEQSFFRRTYLLATGDVPLHYATHYSNNELDFHFKYIALPKIVVERKVDAL